MKALAKDSSQISEETAAPMLLSRERDIVRLIAEDACAKEIASLLGVSVRTIDRQRCSILDKLGVKSNAGLVKYAIREGLASLV